MSTPTSPRLVRAADLVATIRTALAGADLADVVVTLDGRDVPQYAPQGAVVVLPPTLTFPTYHQTQATWEVVVTAGPADQYLAAWDRIDLIIAALAPGMDFSEAEPTNFQTTSGGLLPAYTLTYDDPE